MFDITDQDLIAVYEQLKDRYEIKLTNSFSVDDGFREDFQILVGHANGREFWLYNDYGIFVFSVEVPGQTYHDHWHPMDVSDAVEDIIEFMEGTNPQ